MGNIVAIAKKDLRLYFSSLIAYIVIAVFLLISGYFFASMVNYFALLSMQATNMPMYDGNLNLTEIVIPPLLMNISTVMIFMLPIISMRSFSEEKRDGTLELIFTYPLTDFQIVIGKFLALSVLFMAMLLPVSFYPFIIKLVGGVIEFKTYYVGMLGLVLMGISFLSLGILVSSLTKNQIVAVSVSFSSLLLFFMVGWTSDMVSEKTARFFREISIIDHFGNFARGLIDTQDILFYLLFTFYFLFFTLRVVESRNWRG